MAYPRLVIPFANSFLVRYLLHTGMLKDLAEFSQPVILLRWGNNALKKELMDAGAQVHPLPAFQFGGRYEHCHHRKVFWHKQLRKLKATNIDRRRYLMSLSAPGKFKRLARDTWMDIELRLPGRFEALQCQEEEAFWKDTNARDFEHLLCNIKADVVFSITPFLLDEEPLLRAAKRIGLPLITSILSFDNLTTKDPLPVVFDLYCVWNQYNAGEIRSFYPESQNKHIVITGPPQFDFYTKSEFLLSRDDWMKCNGLQSDASIILFGGGVKRVSPHEPQLLFQIYQAVQSGKINGKPLLLFRKHPLDDDDERWAFIKENPGVCIDFSWSARRITDHDFVSSLDDIRHFVSTLFYSSVHINSASTLTVDGSFLTVHKLDLPMMMGIGWNLTRLLVKSINRNIFCLSFNPEDWRLLIPEGS